MTDRINLLNGRLEEIVCSGPAHLEHLGTGSWFLSMIHADGTETCIWFKTGKHPRVEKRGKPVESGENR
jgi:hypothetical protein